MPRKRTDANLPAIDWANYPGFDVPHYTSVPDDFFDFIMPHLTGAELKVLLYVIRRTFGFKRDADAISIDQLCNGIRRADGTHLDLGTRLAKTTALDAVKSLAGKGLLIGERQASPEFGYQPTLYRLRFRAAPATATPSPVYRTTPSTIERTSLVRSTGPTRNSDQRNSTPEGVYPQTPSAGDGDGDVWGAVVASVMPMAPTARARAILASTRLLEASGGCWRVLVPDQATATWLRRAQRLVGPHLPAGVTVDYVSA